MGFYGGLADAGVRSRVINSLSCIIMRLKLLYNECKPGLACGITKEFYRTVPGCEAVALLFVSAATLILQILAKRMRMKKDHG